MSAATERGRPVANRWIGQRIDDPPLDIVALARAQGVEAEGPIRTGDGLEQAILRGLTAVEAGRPYLVEVLVGGGFVNPVMSRGE